jgi:hypothetical protein
MKAIYIFFFSIWMFWGCTNTEITPDITSALIIDIPFEESAKDYISGTFGTVNKATFTEDHKNIAKKAMLFHSSDTSFVDFGDLEFSSFTNNIFTISVWVKVMDTSKPIAILSKRNPTGPFEYSLDNHFNKSYFNFDNWVANGSNTPYGPDPLKSNAGVLHNQWVHYVYIADGAKMTIYINGVKQLGEDLKVSGADFANTTAHFVVGNGGAFGKNLYFEGAIDDIKMYSRVLTQKQIEYLYGK